MMLESNPSDETGADGIPADLETKIIRNDVLLDTCYYEQNKYG